MGCASSKAANPVVATPQIPPNKVQGYEAQTIGLKRGAHESAAALPSDTPATNVSRGSEVLKLQSKAWYKNADGTQAVCTILKVHYDDNTAILYDRSKLEPLSKAVKLHRIDGACFWSTKCSRISIARWNVVLFAESVDVFVFEEAVRWGMRTVNRRRHRRHRRRAPALPRCRSLQLEPNQAIPQSDGTAKGRIPSLSP